MREPENNNYKPIFQSFLNLLPKCKKLQLGRLRKDLRRYRELTADYYVPRLSIYTSLRKTVRRRRHAIHRRLAEKYLRKFAAKGESDTTYGLYDRNGNFYIGNKPVVIIDNNIVVDGEEYHGTPGLWELIVSKNTDNNIYTNDDYDN